MDGIEKDSISHRKRAFVKLRDYMSSNKDELAKSLSE
jgi:inosine/xanthosine triphosphate pyrophosphatase family protein